MLNEEANYKLLKQLESNPAISQRELAREMGMVKANNFQNSQNKLGYLYVLTPKGIESKATLTGEFLKRKVTEYEALQKEIAQLRQEIKAGGQKP